MHHALRASLKVSLTASTSDTATNYSLATENLKKMVKILLKYGADPNIPNKQGITPADLFALPEELRKVMIEVQNKKSSTVSNKEKLNAELATILNQKGGSSAGVVYEVLTLIKEGANPNIQDSYGDTFLHHVLKASLKASASDTATDHSVVKENFKKMVKILLKKGADPNIPNKAGLTSADILELPEELRKVMIEAQNKKSSSCKQALSASQ